MNSAEKNYSVTELELLSIVFACDKFRVYILGYPITVLSDHQALTFLFTCRLRNSRLTRWTLTLQEFNLQVEYIPGTENVVDALSCNPVGSNVDSVTTSNLSPCILKTTPKTVILDYQRQLKVFESVIKSQSTDENLKNIMELINEVSHGDSSIYLHYCIFEGVLFYRRSVQSDQWLVCVPCERIDTLIMGVRYHFGHVGPKKCILVIRDFCSFKCFQKSVRTIIRTCDICQRAKISTQRVKGEMKSVLAEVPLGRILVDLYEPLPLGWNGVRYIFVVLDNFSRFVRLYPIKKATAVSVTNRIVNDYIATYGVPRCIVSDHGRQFSSKVWQSRLSEAGVPLSMTSVYHSQSNPAERVMKELGRMFRTYCHQEHTEWPRYITYIEWVLNNTVHEATGWTPQELFLSIEQYNPFSPVVNFLPRVPLEQNTKFTMAQEVQLSLSEKRRLRHDSKDRATSFDNGELVLVRTHSLSSAVDQVIHKFFLLYNGPYKVVACPAQNVYTIADIDILRVIGSYNVIHLRRYIIYPSGILFNKLKQLLCHKYHRGKINLNVFSYKSSLVTACMYIFA